MKKFLKEFKEFAMQGNVIDMAIGIVIGGAFKGIIDSLVKDIISPFIGLIANKDLSSNVLVIGDVAIAYGSFITNIINFILMALVIFVMVKMINRFRGFGKKETSPVAATTKICPFCKSQIPVDATRCGHCTSVLEANI
ncbi:MAG: large conductance mechanosensitive channel protein MscL [Cellulosilyticaceae bacterium]